MGSDKHSSESHKSVSDSPKGKATPEWADGLKQLYDAVVEEPLPDSFKNLLDQLDEPESPNSSSPASDPDGAR